MNGDLKFDSVSQRISLTLTTSLIIASANAAAKLSESIVIEKVHFPYFPAPWTKGLLGLVVFLWAIKIFIDDHSLLVPGKSKPFLDLIFLVSTRSLLIFSMAVLIHWKLPLIAVGLHFFILGVSNLVSLKVKPDVRRYTHEFRKQFVKRARHIPLWAAIDLVIGGMIGFVVYGNLLSTPEEMTWAVTAMMTIYLVADVLLSETWQSEKLIGHPKDPFAATPRKVDAR